MFFQAQVRRVGLLGLFVAVILHDPRDQVLPAFIEEENDAPVETHGVHDFIENLSKDVRNARGGREEGADLEDSLDQLVLVDAEGRRCPDGRGGYRSTLFYDARHESTLIRVQGKGLRIQGLGTYAMSPLTKLIYSSLPQR
jgi:hypothetical protein